MDVNKWQPIETAPKGLWRDVLLYTDFGIVEGYWSPSYEEFRTTVAKGGMALESRPTHWMPLPEPPTNGIDKP